MSAASFPFGGAQPLPAWRSMMFCPADNPRFVGKAHTRGADAIILDLEDSIAPEAKAAARAALKGAVAEVGQGGADVCVRINRPLSLAVADIAAAVEAGATFLMLPKVMGPEHVRLLAEEVTDHELRCGRPLGVTRLVAVVEDALGLTRINAIATASPRLVGLAVGSEDMATDLDAVPGVEALFVAKMLGVHAARAAGLLPIGILAGLSNLDRPEEYAALLARSRAVGFAAAMCVHPSHVPLINDAYGPSAAQLDHARRLVAAFEAGEAKGQGAIAFEGQMVDLPVVARARKLLARAGKAAGEAGLSGRIAP